jgi:tRNA pseudouridine38-40 synthase
VVTAAEVAPRKFDLMGGVKCKLYRYTIYTGRYRPVLRLNRCWHIPRKLDAAAMNQAAQRLVGTKDFKSFAAAKDKRDQTVRTIFRCEVNLSCVKRVASCEEEIQIPCTQYAIRNTQHEDEWIYVDVEGNAFLYNMVRNIVGTLVDVGVGRWRPEKMDEILEARDRTAAGRLAPPEGLCLMWIKY